MRQPQTIEPETLLTSKQASDLLQVNASSVNKWIEEGHIIGFRTPGGHRRIRASDLAAFVRKQGMPVPGKLRAASRRRALVVEHDGKQLRDVEKILGQFTSYLDVTSATSTIEALVNIGSSAPHFVLLDGDVDDVDPLEVCRRLRKEGNGHAAERASPEVIIARTYLTDEFEHRARASGARCCVLKPISRQALVEALRLPAETGSSMPQDA